MGEAFQVRGEQDIRINAPTTLKLCLGASGSANVTLFIEGHESSMNQHYFPLLPENHTQVGITHIRGPFDRQRKDDTPLGLQDQTNMYHPSQDCLWLDLGMIGHRR